MTIEHGKPHGLLQVELVVTQRLQQQLPVIDMAMQAILVRSGEVLPAGTHVIELDIDGQYVEITLGPRPSVAARSSMQPDARVRSTSQAISGFLVGSPADTITFEHVSGDPAATRLLVQALGGAA